MSMRWVITAVAGSAASLVVTGPGLATQSPPGQAVRECIEHNGARYATPDKAWITQYISLADACRARFGKEGDVSVTVTPLATGVTASAASPPPAGQERDGASRDSGRSEVPSAVRKPHGRANTTPGPAARKATATPLVNAALAGSQVRESVIRNGLASGWLLVILLGLPLAVAAVRVARRR